MRSLQSQISRCARLQGILGLGMLGALLGFLLLGYRPATQRLATLKLEVESRRQELEQNQQKARNLLELTMEVARLESQVKTYDRQFPKQMELGHFIGDLTQIARQLAIQEWRYTPGAPKRNAAYYELPIQMQFQGDFLNVASFLRQMEDLQRLTRVNRVNIRSKGPGSGVVEVDLTMNIYFSEG